MNNRGQFRRMKMADLQKSADHPTWLISENSVYLYSFPVALSRKEAQTAGQNLSVGIPVEQIRQVGVYTTAASPQTHIGPFLHAIDFLVPDGTEVLAALSGEIIEVVQDNTEWGDESEYRNKLNYLTIRHFDHKTRKIEFSQYCHLAQDSVADLGLKVGSRVEAGQVIAKVGKTGITDRDHLHFIVFRMDPDCSDNPFPFRSLTTRFV